MPRRQVPRPVLEVGPGLGALGLGMGDGLTRFHPMSMLSWGSICQRLTVSWQDAQLPTMSASRGPGVLDPVDFVSSRINLIF